METHGQTRPDTARTDCCGTSDERYTLLRDALNAAGIDVAAGLPDYVLAQRVLDTEQGRELLAETDHAGCEAVQGDELGRAWCHHGVRVDAEQELAPWERELLTGQPQDTVLDDAKAAVYGDRQGDYGHPREDFTRTAIIWTGLLQHKLAEGAYIDAEDVPRCMIGVKLARDVHAPKRDNRVDGAGYWLTLDRLETGR